MPAKASAKTSTPNVAAVLAELKRAGSERYSADIASEGNAIILHQLDKK